MRLFGLVASLLSLGVLADAASGQVDVVVSRAASRTIGVGDGDFGATLTGTLSGSSRVATFIGLPFQPTWLTARALGTATPRLFGASREAVFADGQVNYSDGRVGYMIPSGERFFIAGQSLSARAVLRIAGQTVLSTQQSATLAFDRSARYPLFGVSTPAFDFGPVTVNVGCDVSAVGHYHGGMTVRPRTTLVLPYVALEGHAHGYVETSARVGLDLGIASGSVSATITLGNTHVDANAVFGQNFRSGHLGLTIEAIRLYIRACARLPFWSSCRTLYDRAFGGASWSWAF